MVLPASISISKIRQSIETKLDSQDHYEEFYRPKEKTKDPLQSRWICDLCNIIPANEAKPWQKSTLQPVFLITKFETCPMNEHLRVFGPIACLMFKKSGILGPWVLCILPRLLFSLYREAACRFWGRVQGQRLSPRTEGRLRPLFLRVNLDQRSSHFHLPFPNYTVSLYS